MKLNWSEYRGSYTLWVSNVAHSLAFCRLLNGDTYLCSVSFLSSAKGIPIYRDEVSVTGLKKAKQHCLDVIRQRLHELSLLVAENAI